MTHYKLYIDGQWRDTNRALRVIDPGSGEHFATVASGDSSLMRLAFQAAESARRDWEQTTALQRGDLLLNVAERLRQRREEVSVAIARENGKPLPQALGEVAVSIDHLRWFAEEARRCYGRVVPHQADGKRHIILKRPIGVVLAIAPWNFPLVLAVRKIAPALAAGCPVILRPASKTPVSAALFARCFEEAGGPKGAFQTICGPATELSAEFLSNPICRKITFTGSTEVGRTLRANAPIGMRLSLELGGNAPFLVFADADFERAVDGAIIAKFRNNGQSCIAANRFYVERSIYDRFVSRFSEKINAMKVGYGLDPDVEVSALIGKEALDTALALIGDATKAGARLITGGKRWEGGGERRRDGHYLAPTLLADVPQSAGCMHTETFAPVAPVAPFETEDEAIALANDTPYGLAAYAYTQNLSRSWRMAECLEAGTIAINDPVPSTSNCPFGGYKESGIGRELGSEGLDAFTETTHASVGI